MSAVTDFWRRWQEHTDLEGAPSIILPNDTSWNGLSQTSTSTVGSKRKKPKEHDGALYNIDVNESVDNNLFGRSVRFPKVKSESHTYPTKIQSSFDSKGGVISRVGRSCVIKDTNAGPQPVVSSFGNQCRSDKSSAATTKFSSSVRSDLMGNLSKSSPGPVYFPNQSTLSTKSVVFGHDASRGSSVIGSEDSPGPIYNLRDSSNSSQVGMLGNNSTISFGQPYMPGRSILGSMTQSGGLIQSFNANDDTTSEEDEEAKNMWGTESDTEQGTSEDSDSSDTDAHIGSLHRPNVPKRTIPLGFNTIGRVRKPGDAVLGLAPRRTLAMHPVYNVEDYRDKNSCKKNNKSEKTLHLPRQVPFGVGCSIEEHIKYGACLDGKCESRTNFEKRCISSKTSKRRKLLSLRRCQSENLNFPSQLVTNQRQEQEHLTGPAYAPLTVVLGGDDAVYHMRETNNGLLRGAYGRDSAWNYETIPGIDPAVGLVGRTCLQCKKNVDPNNHFTLAGVGAFCEGKCLKKWCIRRAGVGHQKLYKTPAVLSCAENGEYDELCRLLEGGCDPGFPDRSLRTPLHVASRKGDARSVARIICGAFLGRKFLHCRHTHTSGCTCFNPIPSINCVDKSGRTPLHLAAKAGHLDVITILLRTGANIDVVDKNGQTPISLSTDPRVLRYLKETTSLTDGLRSLAVTETQSFKKTDAQFRNTTISRANSELKMRRTQLGLD